MTDHTKSIHYRLMTARRDNKDGSVAFDAEDVSGSSRRSWFRPMIYTVAGVALISAMGMGFYQFPFFAKEIAQATGRKIPTQQPLSSQQRQQQATPAELTDPFLTHASQAGVKTCAATYAGLGRVLTDGTQFMVQTQTATADVDRRAMQAVVGMAFHSSKDNAYSGPAAGLVFAAPTAQGCEGTMVRVVPFAQDCQAAAALLPVNSQQQQPLSGLSVFALSTGGQAMLVPAASGCVAISIVRSGA